MIAALAAWNAFFGADPPEGYVESVCVEGHLKAGDDTLFGTRPQILKLAPGVTTNARDVELCDASPSTRQRVLEKVASVPATSYPAIALLLVWLLVRRARWSGFFVPRIALGVGRVGLFVLLWGVLVTALQGWAASQLVQTMAPDGTVDGWYQYLDNVLTPLLVGFGLLAVSRVLAQAVPMQHQLDATV